MNRFPLCALLALALPACATVWPSHEASQTGGPSHARNLSSGPQLYMSSLSFGPSVPASDPSLNLTPADTSVEKAPTRISGGERITIRFTELGTHKPVPISMDSLRLVGYSASGRGQVLVRSAAAHTTTDVPLPPLTTYAALQKDARAQNHDGTVMLGNKDSVYFAFPSLVNTSSLSFTLEGFGDDDASVLLQFVSTTQKVSEWITRTVVNPPDTGGGGGGGSYDSNQYCSGSNTCANSNYQCINGVCTFITSTGGPGSCDNGPNSCSPGETCCSGLCKSSGCN